MLLDDGRLRHYTNAENEAEERHGIQSDYEEDIAGSLEPLYHDYDKGLYCIDKVRVAKVHINCMDDHKIHSQATSSTGEENVLFANICLARKEIKWSDSNFLLRKILNPIFHGISLVILLVIAIIYFILPTLR